MFNSLGAVASDDKPPTLASEIYQDILQNNRVKNTGLFLSFPETLDHKLCQQAATYDQGVVGLLALQLGDFDTAGTLIKFFNDRWDDAAAESGRGGLANFYNGYFATAGIEQTTHVGPNAWIGLMAARSARLAGNAAGQELALKIARWIKDDVPHRNGAVAMSNRMDPLGIPWPSVFSTENNISYYTFLSELLKLPLSDEDRISFTRERWNIEYWLAHVAYRPDSKTVLRGINPQGLDRTPALDVYTWLFLAMGPRKLKEISIDPEALLNQAANRFETEVNDQLGVGATDAAHTGGHPTIWYEGQGHYILCLNKVIQYAGETQARRRKIDRLIRSFDRGSLSPGRIPPRCPYSTPAEDPSPALISSVWRAFVDMNYDPLRDATQEVVPLHDPKQIALWRTLGVEGDLHEMVRYGNSEEMMSQIWTAVRENDSEEALLEANALIQEWSLQAQKEQETKKQHLGGLVSYNGNPRLRDEICSYAALNDVSAAFFVMGKILHEQGRDEQAKLAFNQIFEHYSYGQVWDPQGWFWSTAQSAFKDYIEAYPKSFGLVTPTLAAEIPNEVPPPN